MAQESFVGVAADGAGKKIRNLSLQVVQTDGTLATVQMQVVTIADDRGYPVEFGNGEWHAQMLAELTAIRRGMEVLTGSLLTEGG